MDSNNLDAGVGDKCNSNGDCSPTQEKQPFELNHVKNIDDISTPSELKFDQGIVNSLHTYFLITSSFSSLLYTLDFIAIHNEYLLYTE